MAIMASFMPFSMPLMMAAMPTRLATPKMMPSMVNKERTLWAHTSLMPTVMVLERVIGQSYSYLQALIVLSRAALIAGKIPARIPTRILKPNATASAPLVIIGALSVGAKELISRTSANEVTSPV